MAKKHKPSILLVDDNPINLHFLKEALSLLDVDIITANSGYEAINLVEQHEISLIISDVQMPGINGIETIKKIKQSKTHQEIYVIFISAIYTNEEDILKGIESGGIDFLPKPFNIKILLGKVTNFIEYYKFRKERTLIIEKLKQTNTELNAHKNLLEKITSSINDAIILVNSEQNIVYWNVAAEKIFGFATREVLNRPVYDVLASKETKKEFQQMFFGLSARTHEFIASTKKKRQVIIEFTTSEVELNKERHIVGTFRDVSERKRVHEEMLKAKEIKESNKTMRIFLDNLSHELKTPLNSIIGISKRLIKEKNTINNEQLDSLNVILSSGEKLNAILKNMLEFKSPGKALLIPLSIKKLVSELEEFIQQMIPPAKKKVKFKTSCSPQLLSTTILTDETKLVHALLNIIENAVKFTPEGEIVLKITKTNSNVVLSISDTGIGIKKEDLDTIFNMFTQLDSDNDRKYGGLGLGLALAKKNIEELGGKITIDSTPNKGTIVSLHHPVK